jgi:hypothetical protein
MINDLIEGFTTNSNFAEACAEIACLSQALAAG